MKLVIGVQVWMDADACVLRYELTGLLSALKIPAAQPQGGPADGLWQHTCFEAFCSDGQTEAYQEFNFAPSGRWAAYRFAAERVRDTDAQALHAPVLDCRLSPQALSLTASLPRAALPPSASGWALGLSAVVEETDGRLSYWALHHPGARPDFHHPGGRTLRLAHP
ncbi:DOMON-like domain-containing protein [Hydrogenophaga sp.]|uniref:DOMON-like domain-containing protein n=1 Tax=Hydrogenophaga sp. TaxID=1904254 RepID=UPI00260E1AAB|nr:DOMON-like domain-containing protein [Hydrogenophaga sp.]MCW5654667.1 DOMON-like domain-containing protein [Hydrogenophaga sp.]